MADLDLQAGRPGDAAAHLREAAQIALQTGLRFTILNVLDGCGHLCAATGRPADAITVWAAVDTLGQQGGFAVDRPGCAPPGGRPAPRPGRRSARTGPARPSSAARR